MTVLIHTHGYAGACAVYLDRYYFLLMDYSLAIYKSRCCSVHQ